MHPSCNSYSYDIAEELYTCVIFVAWHEPICESTVGNTMRFWLTSNSCLMLISGRFYQVGGKHGREQPEIPCPKLTWKPMEGPLERIVFKGAPLHFHVNLEKYKLLQLLSGIAHLSLEPSAASRTHLIQIWEMSGLSMQPEPYPF